MSSLVHYSSCYSNAFWCKYIYLVGGVVLQLYDLMHENGNIYLHRLNRMQNVGREPRKPTQHG